jgi:drug/metabolite transporter (DMT)-like permease
MPMTPTTKTHPGRVWLGLGILYLVWGSTYLAISVAVETIPPFLMAAVRFSLAGSLLLAWMVLRHGNALVRPARREVRDSAIVGTLLLGGGMGFVAWGQQTIPSGLAAVLVALMPAWVAGFGRAFFGERLPRIAAIGIVVGFVGVAILVGPTALGQPGALDGPGIVAIILAPIAWSIGSLYASHRATLPRQPLVATGLQMLSGSVALATFAIITGEPSRFDIGAVAGPSVLAFLYLTLIGSVLAFTTFGWMLRVAPLPIVTTYAYVNPVIAVILGALILAEPIEPRTVLAAAIIVGAVALIVTARARLAPAPTAGPSPAAPPAPADARVAPTPSRSASG